MKIEQLKKELIACIDWSVGDYNEELFIKLIEMAKIEWGYEEYKRGWEECEKVARKAIYNAFKS